MTTQGTRDEHNRKFIGGPQSSPDTRRVAKKLQELFPPFFFEDDKRNVWANVHGAVVVRATQLASDPCGPISADRHRQIILGMLHSNKKAWAAMTIAEYVAKTFSTAVLMSLCETMSSESAAYHIATEAVKSLAKDWHGPNL